VAARAAVRTQAKAAPAAHAPAAHEHAPAAPARSFTSAAARAAWNFTSVPSTTTLLEPEAPDRTIVLQRKCACGRPAPPDGECDECRARRLQRKGTTHAAPAAAPAGDQARDIPSSVAHVLSRPGDRLDRGVRDFMESRFGEDFGGVRIHTDGAAAASARDVHAQAYTVGRHVVFGAGRYAPATAAGQRLIAHELTHVVQQRNGLRAETAAAAHAAEAEALSNESRVFGSAPLTTIARSAPLARQAAAGAAANRAPVRCTQDQYDTIVPAANLALQWLDRSLDSLRRFIANPGLQANADTRRALQRYFRSRDPATAQRVLDRLALIRADVASRLTGAHLDTCAPADDAHCRGLNAYVTGRNPRRLLICPGFFENSLESRANTVVHEMAHAIAAGRVGRGHIADRGYEDERVMVNRLLSTPEALTNAESYSFFVQDLGTGERPAMSAPEDPIARECDTIGPEIRVALARAQQANRMANARIERPRAAALVRQHLGQDTPAIRTAAKQFFKGAVDKFEDPIDVGCHSNCGGRRAFGEREVDRRVRGAVTGLAIGGVVGAIVGGIAGVAAASVGLGLLVGFGIAALGTLIGRIAGGIASRDLKIQICPGWRDLPEPDRIEWMLRAAYEAFGHSPADSLRYAQLAIALQDRFFRVPTLQEIDRDFARAQAGARAPAPAPAQAPAQAPAPGP
jgi:hypothetical protein